MEPLPGKVEYPTRISSKAFGKSVPGKVEYPTPVSSKAFGKSVPGKVEYPTPVSSKAFGKSIPGKVVYPTRVSSLTTEKSISVKVEYPTRVSSIAAGKSVSGRVKYPTQPRIHAGLALMPIPEKAEYFPSKGDEKDFELAVEKARKASTAKFCTTCNCLDDIGWCKDCNACIDCCPDFIDP
ncbi:hypothetical protein BGZ96_009253 [Linnemannia gamsii]|uniref:Uncharacterized protein n=1 Tax=Linnemannia gamsii TaxID=64522 RepID=A0ABQ7JWX3_9FUNG|nr:hypothetical protein BGZ96_009253 [Linnemannia gamsii]